MTANTSRDWQLQKIGELSAMVGTLTETSEPATSVLVLLHGVGSNEQDLARLGDAMAPTSQIVSLRAPGVMGPGAYAWFPVQFGPQGAQHNGADVEKSRRLLDETLNLIRTRFAVTPKRIVLFGFSQGAIMVLGLALESQEVYGGYIACSGRTLPEFLSAAHKQLPPNFNERAILVAHGTTDDKILFVHAEKTRDTLKELGANLEFKSYPAPHTVPQELVTDAKTWIAARL